MARKEKTPDAFFTEVYKIVRAIPLGRVTSYGAIARYLATASSSRMVGYAMNHSHTEPLFVPAHRVVNRAGFLTGKHHFPGADMMQQLLENEGHLIENDRICEFKQAFWDPAVELAGTEESAGRP